MSFGACCCSPLGPGPSPSPSGGASLVGMPLHFPFGGGFSCCTAGGATGFSGGTPAAPSAFSSGGASADLRSTFGRAMFGWISGASIMNTPALGLVVNIVVPGGGSVPANSGVSLNVTVPGVLPTDSVWANQTSATFAQGIGIVNAFSAAANQVTLQIHNCTTSSQAVPTNFPLRVGILRG